MQHFRIEVSAMRRRLGRSATGASAYRSGQRIVDWRTGEIFDYRRRSGVLHTELVGAIDREKLWNGAEAEKRANAVTAREILVSLPVVELALNQQACRNLAQAMRARWGVACDIAIHAPSKRGSQKNIHSHILISTRSVSDEGTFGLKTRVLDDRETGPKEIEWLREEWARIENATLKKARIDASVDHRSYERQGIQKQPGFHLGPCATAIVRKNSPEAVYRKFERLKDDLSSASRVRPPTAEELLSPLYVDADAKQKEARRFAHSLSTLRLKLRKQSRLKTLFWPRWFERESAWLKLADQERAALVSALESEIQISGKREMAKKKAGALEQQRRHRIDSLKHELDTTLAATHWLKKRLGRASNAMRLRAFATEAAKHRKASRLDNNLPITPPTRNSHPAPSSRRPFRLR